MADVLKTIDVRVPSEKTARALEQARELRHQFYSMEEMLENLNGEAGEKAEAHGIAKKRDIHP